MLRKDQDGVIRPTFEDPLCEVISVRLELLDELSSIKPNGIQEIVGMRLEPLD